KVEQVRLNPTAVQNVVTYNTIVAVDNHNMLLRPGMTATVSVVVRKAEQAVRVPAAALRFRPEGFQGPQTRRAGGAGGPGPGSPGAAGQGGGIPGAAMAGEQRGAGAAGGQAPAGAGAQGAPGAPGGPGGGQGRPGLRGPGGPGGPGSPGGPGGGGGAGWGRGRPTTVFVLDEAGKPKPVEVRVGIS